MAKQTVHTGNQNSDKSMLGWVSDVAGRVGIDRVGSYLGVERVGNVLGEAMQGAARTKARVDKNIEVLLTLANLPSKRDYRSLKTKLDALQGALMNLNRKLDHLTDDLGAAATGRGNGRAGRASSTRAKAKGTARKAAAKSALSRKSPAKSSSRSRKTATRKRKRKSTR